MYTFDNVIKELKMIENWSSHQATLDQVITANSLLVKIGKELTNAGEEGLTVALNAKVISVRKKIKTGKS